jgi:hypothetical protein
MLSTFSAAPLKTDFSIGWRLQLRPRVHAVSRRTSFPRLSRVQSLDERVTISSPQ